MKKFENQNQMKESKDYGKKCFQEKGYSILEVEKSKNFYERNEKINVKIKLDNTNCNMDGCPVGTVVYQSLTFKNNNNDIKVNRVIAKISGEEIVNKNDVLNNNFDIEIETPENFYVSYKKYKNDIDDYNINDNNNIIIIIIIMILLIMIMIINKCKLL